LTVHAFSGVEPTESLLHTPFLERASEPGNRERAHALGAFLTLRAVDRISQHATLAADALAFQLRAAAEYLDELHPQTKEVSHLREVIRVAQRIVVSGSRELLWAPLLAFAYWLESEMRLPEALDTLETAFRANPRVETPEQVAGYLQFARVLRLCGRFEEARVAYAAGGDLATTLGDHRSSFVSRIGRATVLLETGDLQAGELELRSVLAAAKAVDDTFVEARACHDLSVAVSRAKRPAEAVPLVFHAFELYDESIQKARALGDMGVFLKDLGHYSAANEAFQAVLQGSAPSETRANAHLELLELSSALQDRIGFKRWRKELEKQLDRLPPYQRVDFAIKLGAGLASFGNVAEASQRLTEAMGLAEKYKFGQRIFEAEQLLKEIKDGNTVIDEPVFPAFEVSESQTELKQAIEGLFALRSAGVS
jgi:tetratricopeptide (TPR) repeat protein